MRPRKNKYFSPEGFSASPPRCLSACPQPSCAERGRASMCQHAPAPCSPDEGRRHQAPVAGVPRGSLTASLGAFLQAVLPFQRLPRQPREGGLVAVRSPSIVHFSGPPAHTPDEKPAPKERVEKRARIFYIERNLTNIFMSSGMVIFEPHSSLNQSHASVVQFSRLVFPASQTLRSSI